MHLCALTGNLNLVAQEVETEESLRVISRFDFMEKKFPTTLQVFLFTETNDRDTKIARTR